MSKNTVIFSGGSGSVQQFEKRLTLINNLIRLLLAFRVPGLSKLF